MIGPVAGALLAETRRRPGRLLLTGLAVLVATVFAAGTLLLSETLRGYVAETTQMTPDGAAVVVRTTVDPAVVAAVPGVAGVAAAGSTYLQGPGTLWEVTSDPMTGPLTRLPALDGGTLPTRDDEVLAGRETAARTGLAPGAELTLVPADGPPITVTVSGIVALTWDQNDELVGRPGLFARAGGEAGQLDVAAAPGVDADALAARVGAAIGAPDAVRTGAEQRIVEAREASASVTAVLAGVGVFAGLALVAAAVVVASTFRIVLTQRRTQLALLRCVGAGRRQLIGAVLAEAALSGLVAGVLGAGAALLAGHGVLAATGLAGIDPPELVVPWPGLAGCVLVAVVTTVLAAVAPAVAASRIPPVAALGSATAGESGAPRTARRLVLAGLLAVLAALTAAGALLLTGELGLVLLAASGMVAFAAIVAAGPLLVRALAATVGRAVAAAGPAGRLAVANAADVPRRTAATIAVLALGVGLTSALLVGLESTRADAEATLAGQFPTDIVVTGPPGLAAALAATPGLVVVRSADGAVYVDPTPGTDDAAVRDAVAAAVADRPGVLVEYASDARADLESILLTLSLVGLGLVGMTMLVAVVGVAVTLTLSVTERARETGLLRAVGLTRRGVRAMVAWEAALSGTGAGLLGAGVGALYGALGLQVLGVGAGVVPGSAPTLAVLVVGVVGVAVLAATAPAIRAGRTPPIRALQDA